MSGGGPPVTETAESHRLDLDGAELVLRWRPPAAAGAATILYLHGFGSSQDGEKGRWFRARAAAAGLGFCSLDFRGHGLSGGGLAGLTFSRNLEDAGAALEWLGERGVGGDVGGSPLAVFGSSMGGAVGLWLAARRPSAFAAALAIAPALGMEQALEERLGVEAIGRWRDSGRLRYVTDLVDDELGWELMEDLARYPAGELPAALVTPTLVFQGMGDDSVDWRLAVELARAVRQVAVAEAEAVEVREAGEAGEAAVAGSPAGRPGRRVEVQLFSAGDHRLLDLRPRMWSAALAFLAELGLLPDAAPAAPSP